MANDDELKRALGDMAKEGRLQLVLGVLREEFRAFEADLRNHFLDTLLCTPEAQARVFGLQGAMKGLDAVARKLRTLAGLNPET